MQWAAVTTHSGVINDPPQLNDLPLPLNKAIWKEKIPKIKKNP